MYEMILWMCLLVNPECPVWQSANHNLVLIYPTKSLRDCEDEWQRSLQTPDPEGMKSRHICQPIIEPI